MRSSIPNILRAVNTATWAILPEKLDAMLEFLELRASGVAFTDAELAARGIGAASGRPTPRVAGQVAVLPLYGVIGQHAGMEMQISGGTSTEAFGRAFDDAINNPDVGAIVIDAASPGGSTFGVPELAAKIFNARDKGKRIVTVANSELNSASYWIGSAAHDVVATPSAFVGSIGVFTMHTDTSGAESQAGIKRTVISAGRYKGEAAPGVPLTDEALAAKQAMVSEAYAMFAGDVARFRGVTLAAVKAGYGEGRSVSAKQALAAGMIDRIATLDEVLADLSGRSSASSPRRFAATGAVRMAALDMLDGLQASEQTAARRIAAGDLVDPLPVCPECGAAMVDDTCPECGYTAPESLPTDDEGPEARGGAPTGAPLTPADSRPALQARSVSVTEEELAAQKAAWMKAETTRQHEIRTLCAENGIEADAMNGFIAAGTTMEAVSAEILRAKRAQRAADPTIRVGGTREEQKPWESLGHFASAVMDAGTPGSTKPTDIRLFGAASGVNQGVPSEGGFTVPAQFSTKIWDEMAGDADDLVSMTDNYSIEGESLTMNANAETSRATGSRFGGVRGYWINEADQVTKSKPKFRALRLEPQELGVFIYATDKSLRNSPVALGSYLDRASREEIKFLSGAALYAGTGAGQPQGAMLSGSLLTVNKETSQPAATLQQENISKMWARLHPRARAGAVWMMSVDCEPQLDVLNTVVKNVAGTENVGGYANKVYDAEKRTIKGRPIVNAEYCETLGTKGDILLVNWGWYATGTRSAGVRSDTSIHLRFDYNETAFRFMYELDGQPWLADPLTPFKGANTLSWAVALQTR